MEQNEWSLMTNKGVRLINSKNMTESERIFPLSHDGVNSEPCGVEWEHP